MREHFNFVEIRLSEPLRYHGLEIVAHHTTHSLATIGGVFRARQHGQAHENCGVGTWRPHAGPGPGAIASAEGCSVRRLPVEEVRRLVRDVPQLNDRLRAYRAENEPAAATWIAGDVPGTAGHGQ